MDQLLARRLVDDEEFHKSVVKLVKDYVDLGVGALSYWIDEFDAAQDILMCYAPLSRADLENLERGHPRRFILPMTTTQISTMTTFLAQSLFGESTPHKVEGRGPEDEIPAEHMNQLLRWNAEQQPTYKLGYLWIQDILTFNRGVFYNSWAPIYKSRVEQVEISDRQDIDPDTNEPRKYLRTKRTQVPVAGFCKAHLVSPYDFFCDPALPLWRFQEGRFAGHRTMIAWQELKRRSLLPVDHPAYVLPSAVEELSKKGKGKKRAGLSVPISKPAGVSKYSSRTAFDRNRMGSPNTQQEANSDDPGMVECFETWVRLVPEDNDLYEGSEPVTFQTLLGNGDVVLSVAESTYEHDQYPYSLAEGRPSGYNQFAPSMVMLLKSLQDYVDYLKNRHQEAIMRTVGNVFIARADKINLADFLNPEKEGILIPVLPEAAGDKLDDIIKQVQVNDVTKDFVNEMKGFIDFSETVSGASSNMQGQVEGGETTATEFAGTQQMSGGRMMALARLISVEGLVPQTKQFVANFQQFFTNSMAVRFVPSLNNNPKFRGITALTITPEIIQGLFDFVAHDGTLPGTDSRKVAALSRALEAAAAFPDFFTPQPGNLDARTMLMALLKAAGVNVENFQFSAEALGQMAQPPPGPGPDAGGLLPDLGNLAMPIMPAPSPGPGRPELPSATELPSAAPPQIRPQQI